MVVRKSGLLIRVSLWGPIYVGYIEDGTVTLSMMVQVSSTKTPSKVGQFSKARPQRADKREYSMRVMKSIP